MSAKEISLDSRVEILADTMSQVIDDEAVILSLKKNSYFGLDEVGTLVWELLREGKDLRFISAKIQGEYDVSASQVESDLIDFIKRSQK